MMAPIPPGGWWGVSLLISTVLTTPELNEQCWIELSVTAVLGVKINGQMWTIWFNLIVLK